MVGAPAEGAENLGGIYWRAGAGRRGEMGGVYRWERLLGGAPTKGGEKLGGAYRQKRAAGGTPVEYESKLGGTY